MDQPRWTNVNMNTFSGDGGDGGGDSRGQNSNFTNNAWNNWDTSTSTVTRVPEASVIHALLFGVTNNRVYHDGASEPHMMCLKLGKRQYYEDAVVGDRHVTSAGSSSSNKRAAGVLSRCQVEGCHVALGNVKEYYRRHRVCEIHSKAPNVVVSGVQQRFCQQCSRFHDVIEFDEAKRSCRRRLEGHNLRRRKGTLPTSLPRNFTHSHDSNSMMKQRLGQLSTLPTSPPPSSTQSKPVCALSLLSSPKTEPWISSGDLSSRCSAALYELIAANRATYVSGHYLNQNSSHQQNSDNTMHTSHDTQTWDRFTYNHNA